MKAWLVNTKGEFWSEVVFAETKGKARALALSTDSCEDAHFLDIEVRRMSHLDKYYEDGKWHFDWDKPEDRIILVKEANFVCCDEAFEYQECHECPAKVYCDRYTDVEEKED